MKNITITGIALLAALTIITGCSTTPTAFDRALANVQTNYVPTLALQTNVVTVTNTVVQTITQTNSVGVPLFVTNLTSIVTYQTNVVLTTNLVATYSLTPGSTATGAAGVAGTIGNAVMPGTGSLISGGLLALLSIFLGYRNRAMSGKNDALSQAAGVLAQTIETGRELMSSTPQGQKAADAFTQWMISHQLDAGVITQVTQIVKDSVNNQEAQKAADQILALINKTPPPAVT